MPDVIRNKQPRWYKKQIVSWRSIGKWVGLYFAATILAALLARPLHAHDSSLAAAFLVGCVAANVTTTRWRIVWTLTAVFIAAFSLLAPLAVSR